MIYIYTFFILIKYIPYFVLFILNNNYLKQEYSNFSKMYEIHYKLPQSFEFIYLINKFPEFISIINYRLGIWGKVLSRVYSGQKMLFIVTNNIGSNLKIWHGYSTIINANSIGNNCEIWQNVTIGNKSNNPNDEKKPTIKNNVLICAHAIIIGDITVEDNVIIGAGAVVTKSIPANSIVVGNPSYILKK